MDGKKYIIYNNSILNTVFVEEIGGQAWSWSQKRWSSCWYWRLQVMDCGGCGSWSCGRGARNTRQSESLKEEGNMTEQNESKGKAFAERILRECEKEGLTMSEVYAVQDWLSRLIPQAMTKIKENTLFRYRWSFAGNPDKQHYSGRKSRRANLTLAMESVLFPFLLLARTVSINAPAAVCP